MRLSVRCPCGCDTGEVAEKLRPLAPQVGMTSPSPQLQRRTYTVTEAAHVLGISRSTAYELVASGELPAVRLGRRWVVPMRAVDDLVEPKV